MNIKWNGYLFDDLVVQPLSQNWSPAKNLISASFPVPPPGSTSGSVWPPPARPWQTGLWEMLKNSFFVISFRLNLVNDFLLFQFSDSSLFSCLSQCWLFFVLAIFRFNLLSIFYLVLQFSDWTWEGQCWFLLLQFLDLTCSTVTMFLFFASVFCFVLRT